MKGSCNNVGGRVADIAGDRRCGTKERQMWAVTTSTDAIPRSPYSTGLAIEIREDEIDCRLPTSIQTTSRLGPDGGAIIVEA